MPNQSFEEKLEEVEKRFFKLTAELNANYGVDVYASFIRTALTQCREETIKDFKKLITEEIATAHKEGTPTARLTSLHNRL